MLGKWVRAAHTQAARPVGSEALAQENKQLRAQLARAEMERDILKKALILFSQLTGQRNASLSCRLLARAAAVPRAGR